MAEQSIKELISVIIPAFNAEAFLEEAIQSILAQTYSHLEILLVDDGSSDKTAEIAQSFGAKVRYFFQENRGAPSARNRGITQAKGSYIAFLDADDLWASDKLKWQIDAFLGEDDLQVVLGKLQRIYSPGGNEDNRDFVHLPESWMAFSLGTGLFKRDVFSRIGLLDETLLYCDDIDWFLRARDRGFDKKILDQVVLFYRRHSKNMTLNESKDRQFFLKVLKRSLDRRRALGVAESSI